MQKDVALDELQRLIDSLVQKAAVSHDGAFQLSVQVSGAAPPWFSVGLCLVGWKLILVYSLSTSGQG